MEPGRLAEAQDGDVREPAPLLGPVDAQSLEQPVEPLRVQPALPVEVVEDEHAHAPGLPVGADAEADRPEGVGAADRGRDSLHLGGRRRAEERGRDVEVLAGDDPAAREMPLLPRDERVEDLVGEPEGTEEPEPFIARHATSGRHAESSRFCDRRRRSRWSAIAAARLRIASRSPGMTNSWPRPPSGSSAWRYTRPTGFSTVPP